MKRKNTTDENIATGGAVGCVGVIAAVVVSVAIVFIVSFW